MLDEHQRTGRRNGKQKETFLKSLCLEKCTNTVIGHWYKGKLWSNWSKWRFTAWTFKINMSDENTQAYSTYTNRLVDLSCETTKSETVSVEYKVMFANIKHKKLCNKLVFSFCRLLNIFLAEERHIRPWKVQNLTIFDIVAQFKHCFQYSHRIMLMLFIHERKTKPTTASFKSMNLSICIYCHHIPWVCGLLCFIRVVLNCYYQHLFCPFVC